MKSNPFNAPVTWGFFLAALLFTARGATLTGNIADCGLLPVQSNLRFVPKATPLAIGGTTVIDITRSCQTATNGAFSKFLVGGYYWMYDDDAANPNQYIPLVVPTNDTNTYSLNYCIGLATNMAKYAWVFIPHSEDGSTLTNIDAGKLTGTVPASALSLSFGSLGAIQTVSPWDTSNYWWMDADPFQPYWVYGNHGMIFNGGLVALDDFGEFPTFLCYGSVVQECPATLWLTWDGLPMDVVASTGGMVIGGRYWQGSWMTNTPGQGELRVLGALSVGVPTNYVSVITNGATAFYSANTNKPPNFAAPNGSICTTSNGWFGVRSNGTWIPK